MMKRIVPGILIFLLFAALLPARDFYWENPEPVGNANSQFPASATNGRVSVVVWQDVVPDTRSDGGEIWLSCRVFDGTSWETRERFAGPVSYSGDVPSIVSVTIDDNNRILIPAVTGVDVVSVFISEDLGKTFSASRINGKNIGLVGPRIFVRSDGGYFLYATRGTEDNFTLVFSRSETGVRWPDFQPFGPSEQLRRAFLPTHAATGKRDIIVFQAFHEGTGRASYQLFATISNDAGKTWDAPVLVTGFAEPSETGTPVRYELYHNQRPRLRTIDGTISLVWERARTENERYAIYHTELDPETLAARQVERVSLGEGYSYDPDSIEFDGKPAIVWFDNRQGTDRVYLAIKEGFLWSEYDLSRSRIPSVFARIVPVGGSIEVYWQQELGNGKIGWSGSLRTGAHRNPGCDRSTLPIREKDVPKRYGLISRYRRIRPVSPDIPMCGPGIHGLRFPSISPVSRMIPVWNCRLPGTVPGIWASVLWTMPVTGPNRAM